MEELNERTNDFRSDILIIIQDNIHNTNLESLLEEFHLYDVSQEIINLEDETIKNFFETVSTDYAAEIFEYLDEDDAFRVTKIIGDEKSAKIIAEMDMDEAVDLVKYMKKVGMRILKKINVDQRKELLKLMLYDEDEIGSYITDSYIKINKNFTVKDAMRQLTSEAHDVDYISTIYVIDEKEILCGYIKLKDLILARADEKIEEIMHTRFPKVYPNDDKEYVAHMMQETSESSIPVINENGAIEGIITHDDLMDIIALAQEEDYTRFAGLGGVEVDLESYTLKRSVKSRLPWLSILLALSMITTIILSIFEGSFTHTDGARLLASRLAIYLPLILDMSGNTGTQSLAVMIRYLTKNPEIDNKQIRKHISREFRTGIAQGLLIGILIFLMITITNNISYNDISWQQQLYAIVTAASISVALLVSTTLGAVIPLVMFKLKIDPAVASGPFITTISDIITLTIYYSISLIILLPLFQ